MPESETVSFRLPANLLRDLDARVAQHNQGRRKKLSRNEFARLLLADGLAAGGQEDTLQEIARLGERVSKLREDLATITVALLTQEKPCTRKEAEAFVRRTILD